MEFKINEIFVLCFFYCISFSVGSNNMVDWGTLRHYCQYLPILSLLQSKWASNWYTSVAMVSSIHSPIHETHIARAIWQWYLVGRSTIVPNTIANSECEILKTFVSCSIWTFVCTSFTYLFVQPICLSNDSLSFTKKNSLCQNNHLKRALTRIAIVKNRSG